MVFNSMQGILVIGQGDFKSPDVKVAIDQFKLQVLVKKLNLKHLKTI